MDLRDYNLYLHRSTHYTGKAAWVLDAPTEDYYRTVVPGHNTVAWIVWHIARGEDWAIRSVLQGQEQLLTRDNWGDRMRVSEPRFGGGMERAEMIALNEQIDLEALRGYYDAVAESTQDYLRRCDIDAIDQEFDVPSRLAQAPETARSSPFLEEAFRRWTRPLVWLEVFALIDVAHHMEEADHVLWQLGWDVEGRV